MVVFGELTASDQRFSRRVFDFLFDRRERFLAIFDRLAIPLVLLRWRALPFSCRSPGGETTPHFCCIQSAGSDICLAESFEVRSTHLPVSACQRLEHLVSLAELFAGFLSVVAEPQLSFDVYSHHHHLFLVVHVPYQQSYRWLGFASCFTRIERDYYGFCLLN